MKLKNMPSKQTVPFGLTVGELKEFTISVIRKKLGLVMAEQCCTDIPEGEILRKSPDGTLYKLSFPANGGGAATWVEAT